MEINVFKPVELRDYLIESTSRQYRYPDRRNLTVEQRMYLIGKKYKGQKKQGERTDLTSDHNDQKLTTARKIADWAAGT